LRLCCAGAVHGICKLNRHHSHLATPVNERAKELAGQKKQWEGERRSLLESLQVAEAQAQAVGGQVEQLAREILLAREERDRLTSQAQARAQQLANQQAQLRARAGRHNSAEQRTQAAVGATINPTDGARDPHVTKLEREVRELKVQLRTFKKDCHQKLQSMKGQLKAAERSKRNAEEKLGLLMQKPPSVITTVSGSRKSGQTITPRTPTKKQIVQTAGDACVAAALRVKVHRRAEQARRSVARRRAEEAKKEKIQELKKFAEKSGRAQLQRNLSQKRKQPSNPKLARETGATEADAGASSSVP
jgi:ribosome recycling factor